MESRKDKSIIDNKGRELIASVEYLIEELDKSDSNRDKIINDAMNRLYEHLSTYPEEILQNEDFIYTIYKLERMLKNEFIDIDSEPDYDEDDIKEYPKKIKDESDTKEAMEYLAYETRSKLLSFSGCDINTESFDKMCVSSNIYVKNLCKELKIDYIDLKVNQEIKNGYFHCFTITKFNLPNNQKKYYLIDCTYRQFFTKPFSNINRIRVMRGLAKGASVGSYMVMDEKRKKIAEELLKKGYIEATPENLKEYLDGIVFSGRDYEFYKSRGLDYTNPDDCIPEYTASEYLDMLIKSTRMVNKDKNNKEIGDLF